MKIFFSFNYLNLFIILIYPRDKTLPLAFLGKYHVSFTCVAQPIGEPL